MSTAVQDIEEMQRGLHAVFPEVEADGDVGHVTTSVVIHIGASGMTRLARFVQTILQRTTPELVADGRIGAKTMAALRHLDELGDIESAAETPRLEGDRHVVKASSFADAADVRAFEACKVRGGSDLHCFSLGDNGIGARGANCAQEDRPMIALPREHWRHDGARIATPNEPGTLYVITFEGRDLDAELGDTMPSIHNIKNGAGLDTNPAVEAAFNRVLGRVALRAPYMVTMAWRLKAALVLFLVWVNAAAVSAADVQSPAAVAAPRPATTSWAHLLASGPIPNPPPGTFEPWLLNLCMGLAILVLMLTAVALIMKMFGRTPPMHVEIEAIDKRHDELAKKVDGCATWDETKALRDKLDEHFKTLDSKRSTDIAGLYTELRKQGEELAGVAKEAEMHTQQLTQQNVTLTNILQRLPRRNG